MSRRPTDYSGQRFGMLVVGSYEAGTWSCACDCGTVVQLEPVILRQARALDCGCLAEVSRRELVEGMAAQRELIARLQAQLEARPAEPVEQVTMTPTEQSAQRREKVRELLAQGMSRAAIARQLRIALTTTYYLVPKEEAPARRPGAASSAAGRIDPVQYALRQARAARAAPAMEIR